VTSLIINPLSTFARATEKVVRLAMRRTLTLISMFFEAIAEARAMMAQGGAVGSAGGAASNERRHD
jgi:hypothetical protein